MMVESLNVNFFFYIYCLVSCKIQSQLPTMIEQKNTKNINTDNEIYNKKKIIIIKNKINHECKIPVISGLNQRTGP